MTVEDFTNKLRVAGQSENVDEYRKTLNRISETIYFAHYPHQDLGKFFPVVHFLLK